jgi:hypothetical protein
VLVALVILSIGVLGSLGTMALAWRADRAGAHLAAVAQSTGSLLDSLRGVTVAPGGSCAGAAAGRDSSEGADLRWSRRPARGGQEVTVALSISLLSSVSLDTVWSFLPCD